MPRNFSEIPRRWERELSAIPIGLSGYEPETF